MYSVETTKRFDKDVKRRLTRRSDIRDAVHESFLTRRQQHRRPLDLGRLLPKERKNGQNKTFLFIVCN